MRILGISAFYHDSAAALIEDGDIVAAAQEERFTRKKHDPRFPHNAIAYCLAEAGASLDDVNHIVFFEKPFLKFERLLETYLALAPRGFRSFRLAMPLWIKEKLFQKAALLKELSRFAPAGDVGAKLLFAAHHQSHAAAAFYPSPFDEAVILTLDGVGEWTTASVAIGRGNAIETVREIKWPHSLGLLYSAFTYYLGFRVNSGEYKVMGLAPYGEPTYADLILKHIIDVRDDGSFWLDQSYFNYAGGLTMTGKKFHALLGGPPRRAESRLSQRDMDIAASVQKVTEDTFSGGYLYVGNPGSIVRYRYTAGDLTAQGEPEKLLDLPVGGHSTRNIIFNRAGTKMYVAVGSGSNNDAGEDCRRAAILEFNPDGTGYRVYASGIRNPVGLALQPGTDTIWTAMNERDNLGDNLVPDYATSVKDGGFYGWPYSYIGANYDPRYVGAFPELVKRAVVPDVLFPAHSAALGITFYTGTQFPQRYRNGGFVALHGSWNRSIAAGYKVAFFPMVNGKPGPIEDFFGGFLASDGTNGTPISTWGRPVGVTVSPDGGLLVSDDTGNRIWKITAAK